MAWVVLTATFTKLMLICVHFEHFTFLHPTTGITKLMLPNFVYKITVLNYITTIQVIHQNLPRQHHFNLMADLARVTFRQTAHAIVGSLNMCFNYTSGCLRVLCTHWLYNWNSGIAPNAVLNNLDVCYRRHHCGTARRCWSDGVICIDIMKRAVTTEAMSITCALARVKVVRQSWCTFGNVLRMPDDV